MNSFPSWGKPDSFLGKYLFSFSIIDFPELIADKQEAAMASANDPDNKDPKNVIIKDAFTLGGRAALKTTALLPTGMAIGFLVLVVYFKSQGGYKVIELAGEEAATEA